MPNTAPPDDAPPRAAALLQVLPVSGVSISTVGGLLAAETLSATDDHIARVDELQFDLGEGPCWDAIAAGRPVLEPDLHGAPRRIWPAFSVAVREGPVRALFAFPMAVGPFPIGAIDLYDVRPRELEQADVERAAAFAATTARRVLLRAMRLAARELDGEPIPAHARRVIHQATGFVIVQAGVTAEEAGLLLRASAFAEGRRVQEVAEEIVARRRGFTRTDGGIEEER